MDPKASAKSKRTHSQQGRKNHTPPAAIPQKKKAAQTGGEERPHRNHSHALPSNWDRYDDGNEGEGTAIGSKQSDGEVAPKSKGADFGHLIEQAKSQPQELRNSAYQGSSSFDELSLDFMQGVGSMLSVRGKGLLSWCGDDNFIVDDDPTSSYEVPFLSIDLHALAEQLSKLKLSQRLFIEADLLPEELCMESKKSPVYEQSETSKTTEFEHGLDSPAFLGFPVSEKKANTQTDTHSSIFNDGEMIQGAVAEAGKIEPFKSSQPLEQSGRREVQESTEIRNRAVPEFEQKNISRFEATAAEAELDMLLDSFSETNLSGSVADELITNSSAPYSSGFGSLSPIGGRSISQDSGSSRNVATTYLDDSIDDLLAETSLCFEEQKHTARPQKEGAVSSICLPLPPLGSRPVVACTFSKHEATTASIDDLLAETSVCLRDQKKHTASLQMEGAGSSSLGLPSHTSSLGSKAMEKFDSWLDTI